MPCYDGRSDDDYKYDNGRHDGKQEGYEKGYADAKRKHETSNVIKIEGEHSETIDRLLTILCNQIIDIHNKNIKLRGENEDLKKQKDRNDKLEASLCALITELEKRDIANEVIAQASRSGLIDLMGFWEEHKQEDETKLANKLHTMFSEHEQEVIKKLLNKNKTKNSDENVD
tara:strand:- start:3157 stop:3672 length:516 start_codon:yes stop_codon:yes gene_type:complete